MIKKLGFGETTRKRIPYNRYTDRYLFIKTLQGENIFGRYAGVSEEGEMILSPYQSFIYSNDLNFEQVLCEDYVGLSIKPEIIAMIRPTTKENLENMIRFLNCLERLEEEKRRREFKKEKPDSTNFHLF